MRWTRLVAWGATVFVAAFVCIPCFGGPTQPVYWECLPFTSRSIVCNRQTKPCIVLGGSCQLCDWGPIDGQINECRRVTEVADCEDGGSYNCYTCGPAYKGTCITSEGGGIECKYDPGSDTCSACDTCLH